MKRSVLLTLSLLLVTSLTVPAFAKKHPKKTDQAAATSTDSTSTDSKDAKKDTKKSSKSSKKKAETKPADAPATK